MTSYEKDGYGFIITEVYTTPKYEVYARGENPASHKNQKGAYGKYIRLLILDMLSKGETVNGNSNTIIVGKNEMLERLDMINKNFRYGSYNKEKMAHYLGMDMEFVNEFYGTNTRKLRDSVDTTLKSLMNREKLIFWTTVKVVGIGGITMEATNEEIDTIVNIESKVLKAMGTTTMTHIYAANRLDEYYIRVNKQLFKEGISFAYNAHKIIFSDLVYERNEQLKYKLEIEDEELNRKELNLTVHQNITDSIDSRHDNLVEQTKSFIGTIPPSWKNGYKKTLLDDNFIYSSKKLADICIDNTYDSISESIARAWEDRQDVIAHIK